MNLEEIVMVLAVGGGKYGVNSTGDSGTANTGGGGGGGINLDLWRSWWIWYYHHCIQRTKEESSAGATIDTTSRPGFTSTNLTSTGYFRFVG
ncbi:MAG: hypothetical protein CM15mV20_0040 [uncultured marine virus]|nr:MAG: hypothetical protein CM15mV20_0040 [uncultured marine virus]